MNKSITKNLEEKQPEIEKPKLTLKDFPKKLRLIAYELLDNDKRISINEAARNAGVNENVAHVLISKAKRKNKSFHDLMSELTYTDLKSKVYSMDKTFYEKGLEGSSKHGEIYYKRMGFITETVQHEHKHLHLHHCSPMPSISPAVSAEIDEDEFT